MTKHKKATYDVKDIPWLALIVGIGIVIAAIVTNVISDVRTSHSRPSTSIVNESDAVNLLWGNNTNMTLDFGKVTVSAVYNCSDGADFTTINPGNYTVFSALGYIQCDINSTFPADGNAVCVNYTFLRDDEVYNITTKGLKGQLSFSNWFPTIGLVLGAIVVIVTMGYFGYLRRG